MDKVLFITVRYSSSRLPGKCLKKLGNHSVLGHCILRAKKANFRVIVCTGSDVADSVIVSESIKYDCEVFTGDSLNKILRWSSCFQNFEIEFAHIVDGDDPYFDPIEINESLNLLVNEKLDLVRTSLKSDSGFCFCWPLCYSKVYEGTCYKVRKFNKSRFRCNTLELIIK